MDKRGLIFIGALTGSYFLIQWFYPSAQMAQLTSSQPSSPQSQPTQNESIISSVNTSSSLPALTKSKSTNSSEIEKYYVMEMDDQQLVFSNMGAAITEINLPISTKEKQSPIKKLPLDDKISRSFPLNANFPFQFSQALSPLQPKKASGYYPLLRRSLETSTYQIKKDSKRYCLQVSSLLSTTADQPFQILKQESNEIVFQGEVEGRTVRKTYRMQPASTAPYTLDLEIEIDGDPNGLFLNVGAPEVEFVSGSYSPQLKARVIDGTSTKVKGIDLPKDGLKEMAAPMKWVSNSNGFMGIVVASLTDPFPRVFSNRVAGTELPSRVSLMEGKSLTDFPAYEIWVPLAKNKEKFRVYAGPFQKDLLATVDQTLVDPLTNTSPHIEATQSSQGWFSFITEPFSALLLYLMKFFYMITHSWGFSILLLTVALRLMLYPLNAWSIRSTLKMQQIAPEMTRLQERHKGDPKRLQMEMVQLYRKNGVNPMSGCFPMLIQMPFLFGMFDVLKSTFELRGASFIPGWIDNLTAPDVLFSFPFSIPFFGSDFHLLPILLGAVMYFQQKLTQALAPKTATVTDSQRQQKFMGNIMIVVFTVMFYNFPSGLNLYWFFSMALGMLQQWWMTKRMAAKNPHITRIK